MRNYKIKWYLSFCCYVVNFFTSIVFKLSKYETENIKAFKTLQNTNQPVIFLFWHGRLLLPALFLKREVKNTTYGVFSNHKDGKVIKKFFDLNGIIPIDGSSTSGGVGVLKQTLKVLKIEKGNVGITPDGPIGPRFKITTNSPFFLAQKTGAVIVPLICSASRVKIFNSWDRFFFIKPFGKIKIKIGTPVEVSRTATEQDIEKLRIKVQKYMIKETQKMDQDLLGIKIEPETLEESKYMRKVKRGQIKLKRKF